MGGHIWTSSFGCDDLGHSDDMSTDPGVETHDSSGRSRALMCQQWDQNSSGSDKMGSAGHAIIRSADCSSYDDEVFSAPGAHCTDRNASSVHLPHHTEGTQIAAGMMAVSKGGVPVPPSDVHHWVYAPSSHLYAPVEGPRVMGVCEGSIWGLVVARSLHGDHTPNMPDITVRV